jgi:hypothetical protein
VPGSDAVVTALKGSGGIDVIEVAPERADLALRDGQVDVVVLPGAPPTYRFDPTRPESRLARLAVDAGLQRAAGRADRFVAGEQRLEVVGSRYIDWLVPGLLGMNIMGTGMWGIGFSIVYARYRKLLKRFAATPMARSHYLLAQMLSRLVFLAAEVATLVGFAWLPSRCRFADRCWRWPSSQSSARRRSPASGCSSPRARARSRRCRG